MAVIGRWGSGAYVKLTDMGAHKNLSAVLSRDKATRFASREELTDLLQLNEQVAEVINEQH